MAGREWVKLQEKVNCPQRSSVILLTQTCQQEPMAAWDVLPLRCGSKRDDSGEKDGYSHGY